MKTFLFTSFIFFSSLLNAQTDFSTHSKKAAKHYERALQFFNAINHHETIKELNKALEFDPDFVEAYLLLGEVYSEQGDHKKIIQTYKKAITVDNSFFPPVYFNLASSELLIGKYEDALNHFKVFLSFNNISNDLRKRAQHKLAKCEFALHAIKNPVPFELIRLSDSINTEMDEYWPSLTADGKTLVITAMVLIDSSKENTLENRQEDFFISEFKNGYWTKALKIKPPLNTLDNEGAQSITVDGKIMYFTACNRRDGVGRCDLYFSIKEGKGWSRAVNIGEPLNSSARETQPSISSDGKTLYFASNRKGSKGKMDIWMSTKSDDGKWNKPENLGIEINTKENEISPFIHPDNQTLYFASDGLLGMGRFDLFVSKKINDSIWSKPFNLGYPINTNQDEIGLIVNSEGDKAYFASNRLDIKNKDIYEFELYEDIRPILVSYMKGKVFDADTKKPLVAQFELLDIETDFAIEEALSDKEGEFLVCLPTGKNYALNVSKKGYMFFSEHFSLKEIHDKLDPFLMDVYLNPIRAGEKIILKNIFYETDSYILKKESTAELNKVIQFLNKNINLYIEISGHTDNLGSDEYNMSLSEKRAKSVVDFLLENSIDSKRISYKGFGETQPIKDNDTEQGRASNRRTELRIVAN